jgi:lipoprotein signal peptidase
MKILNVLYLIAIIISSVIAIILFKNNFVAFAILLTVITFGGLAAYTDIVSDNQKDDSVVLHKNSS